MGSEDARVLTLTPNLCEPLQACSGGVAYKYTGRRYDPETGLYYYRARYYSPNLGRFLQTDPIGYTDDLNLYAYVGNDPANGTDPSGLAQLLSTPSQPGMFSSDDTETVVVTGRRTVTDIDVELIEAALRQQFGFLYWLIKISREPSGFDISNGACANATLKATGVDAKKNIAQANKATAVGALIGLPIGLPLAGALAGYATVVKTGGPQDVKSHPGPGTHQQRVDAGNISYGITCPFGAAFCQFAAGAAQTLAGGADFKGTLETGFDTPTDNAKIRDGQAMRAAGCHP